MHASALVHEKQCMNKLKKEKNRQIKGRRVEIATKIIPGIRFNN
jgi:hypothetical protein